MGIGSKRLDRWLRPEIVRFGAGACLAIVALLGTLMFATNDQGRTAVGTTLGGDYGEFDVAGQILNDGLTNRLYDLELQDERLHRLVPGLSKDEHLPFVYPPFLALIFRPLARLPYAWSFAAWLVIDIGLYALSVGLILRVCESFSPSEHLTIWLVALAFPPFAMECSFGGQISAIGCLVVSIGLILGKQGKGLASGLVLSFLFYKPTLLVLILPMLVVSRSWRVLAGLCLGAVVLAMVSWRVAGLSGCLDFVRLMLGYGRSGGSLGIGFKTMKYVDLTAFLSLLGVGPAYRRPVALMMAAPIVAALVSTWWKTVRGHLTDLCWAATICLTPVLNLYGPIYDVTMIVPGVLIGSNAIRLKTKENGPIRLRGLLAFLFISALVTQPLAQKIGFQPLTIGLTALGLYWVWKNRRLSRTGIDARV